MVNKINVKNLKESNEDMNDLYGEDLMEANSKIIDILKYLPKLQEELQQLSISLKDLSDGSMRRKEPVLRSGLRKTENIIDELEYVISDAYDEALRINRDYF